MDMCRFSGVHDHEYRKVVAALDFIRARKVEESANLAPPPSSRASPALDNAQREAALNALWFPAIDARYATIKAAHSRTCKWLLQRQEYRDWFDVNKAPDHHGLLWIKGKPGSGKSTLLKYAVANARRTRKDAVIISFFFNARGEDLERSTLGMYRSLAFQLLRAFPDLQVLPDSSYTSPRDGDAYAWEINDLKSFFVDALPRIGQRQLICFIDALDECEEDQIRDLVAFLDGELGQQAALSQIHFHACLSSRHYPHISIKNGIQLTLEGQEGHVQDIARYLDSELKAGSGRQSEEIKEEILNRACGIFLWVALVVQILNKEYDHGRVHALRRRLKDIPDGLDRLFEDILMRDQRSREELILCLQWILYATRPLKREELYYAILSGTDEEALVLASPETITAEDMERFILSCSKGLAETTKSKVQSVQFIHESVRDFLLGKNGFSKLKSELGPGQSHERLKQCCCIYMKISDISDQLPFGMELPAAPSEEAKHLRTLIPEKFPFLEYSVQNVLLHADSADRDGISQERFVEDFALSDWILLNNLFERYQTRRHAANANLLYVLVKKSLNILVRLEIMRTSWPDTVAELFEDEHYTNLLYAALADPKVNEATIRELLIPIFRTIGDIREPQNAQSDCEFDYPRVAVETIIKSRPKIDPRKGHTLIRWAALEGYDAVVRFLVSDTDMHCNGKDKDGRTPLACAVANGHEAIVNLLLTKQDVDPNLSDYKRRTPLSLAVQYGHEAIANVLLARKDVDPDSIDNHYRSPLSWAAEQGQEAIVNLLLTPKKNEDPTYRGFDGQSALSLAAKNGQEAIVNLLLTQNNVDPSCRDNNGWTPLSLAAASGRAGMFKILLARKNVDPNRRDIMGRTPLSLAVISGFASVVDLLLTQKNVDPNLSDQLGRTPLSHAAENGHEAIVNSLLTKEDVDPNVRDVNDRTPLHLAAFKGHWETINLLLAKENVNLDAMDHNGLTALGSAVSKRCWRAAALISLRCKGIVVLDLSSPEQEVKLLDEAIAISEQCSANNHGGHQDIAYAHNANQCLMDQQWLKAERQRVREAQNENTELYQISD
ncbi:MAG: hypothetical protein Q9225_002468 [Loekoesia sp. 1 TL-2023]